MRGDINQRQYLSLFIFLDGSSPMAARMSWADSFTLPGESETFKFWSPSSAREDDRFDNRLTILGGAAISAPFSFSAIQG